MILILDFRFSIFDYRERNDDKTLLRFLILVPTIENPKSKIENWWGSVALALALRVGWGCGPGAAAEESPSDRVSIVARSS